MSDWEHHDRAWAKFYAERDTQPPENGYRLQHGPEDIFAPDWHGLLANVRLGCFLLVTAAAVGCGYTVTFGEDLGVAVGRVLGIN